MQLIGSVIYLIDKLIGTNLQENKNTAQVLIKKK